MSFFFRLLLIIISSGVVVLRPAVPVLANGGHIHLGDTAAVPFVVVWIGGGLIGALLLIFVIGWSLSNRAKKRSQNSQGEKDIPANVKEEK